MAKTLSILENNFSNRGMILNSNHEIFGSCRHNAKYHTLETIDPTRFRIQFDEIDDLSDDTDEDTEKN